MSSPWAAVLERALVPCCELRCRPESKCNTTYHATEHESYNWRIHEAYENETRDSHSVQSAEPHEGGAAVGRSSDLSDRGRRCLEAEQTRVELKGKALQARSERRESVRAQGTASGVLPERRSVVEAS